MELTSEERQRIYEEERVRIEARDEIARNMAATATVSADRIIAETATTLKANAAKGFGMGVVTSVVGTFFLWGCGIGLCATGIGAILGIPMILGGVVVLVVGTPMSLSYRSAPCPYCGIDVGVLARQTTVKCGACKGKIRVTDVQLFRRP